MRVLVVLLLLLPVASALVVEDPAGDARVVVQDVAQPVPEGRYAAVDTLGLEVLETRDEVRVVLHVADAAPELLLPMVEATTHDVSWRLGTHTYHLLITRQTDLSTGVLASGTYAWLERQAEGDSFGTRVATPEVEVDAEADTYTVVLTREELVDQAGAPALPGTTFGDVHVRSEGTFLAATNDFVGVFQDFGDSLGVPTPRVRATVVDRMPDDGAGAYTVRLGGGEHHGIGLSANEPSRASNGEATTMLFVVRLQNDQPDEVQVRFRADDVPDGWDVWFPAEGATFEAGEAREVPVLVRMPFVHEHGSRQAFTVRAEHAGDDSVYGETALGVVFTEVPQPSGHHPRLWLHAVSVPQALLLPSLVVREDAEGYLNAQETHGDDVPLRPTDVFGDERAPGWVLPLHPGLGMGLDLDVERTGRLEVPVRTGAQPMSGAQLHGRLVHADAHGNETVLATLEDDAAPVDLAGDTRHDFTATLTPTPEADRVPYQPRATLRLEFWLDHPDQAEQALALVYGSDVVLLPGGTLDLPLLEYHDEVDASFGDLQTLRLEADVRERPVNPGEATVFQVRVRNLGAEARTVDLRIVGDEAGWATLAPDRLTLSAGGDALATVGVLAPADARDGEQADLVLEAVDGDGVRALLRLVARVDTAADHEDMTGLAPHASARDSPAAAPAAAVLAVLAAGALAARRRGA